MSDFVDESALLSDFDSLDFDSDDFDSEDFDSDDVDCDEPLSEEDDDTSDLPPFPPDFLA